MYCYYKCSVALPHRVVCWSAVCDCGISTQLLFSALSSSATISLRRREESVVLLCLLDFM